MDFAFLSYYMIIDVFCIVLTFIVAANLRDDSGSEIQVRFFRRLVMAHFVFVTADAIWAYVMFTGFGAENAVLPATFDGIKKVSAAFVGYYWFCYGEARYESPIVYNRGQRLLAAVPAMVVVPLYVFGFATGQNILFLDAGEIVNGPTYFAMTAIALGYLVVATVHAFVLRARERSLLRRRMYLTFVVFLIAPACAAVLDAFVPNLPVMAPAMMTSILLVLLSLQESRISTDALTGLNNRRRAGEYLDEVVERVEDARPLYLFMIDMDRFKSINDTYGHLEGDRALQLMAGALRKTATDLDSFAARWGGDEFMLICAHGVGDGPAYVADAIRERLSREAADAGVDYSLSCSIGSAKCIDPEADISKLVQAADQDLYDNKSSE